MELEQLFPEIKDARAYACHGNYDRAIEIYSDILPEIEQESITYSHALLEYALCLMESITVETEMNYQRILQHQNAIAQENLNEDLELVWDSLETCRVNFEIVNDNERLCEVHKGLGDVHCFNNEFENGIEEYTRAMDYCANDEVKKELFECLAECSRNNKNYEDATKYYREIIDILKLSNQTEAILEYESLIMMLENSPKNNEASHKHEDNEKPTDVNHLKK